MDAECHAEHGDDGNDASCAAQLWREYLETDPDGFSREFAATVTYIRDGSLAAAASALSADAVRLDLPPDA